MPTAADMNKFDVAIEKLTDIAVELKSILAVQEQRIAQQEKTTDSILAYLEKRRDNFNDTVGELHGAIDEREEKILRTIEKVQETNAQNVKEIKVSIEKIQEKNIEIYEKTESKINVLQRWVYTAIGGGMVIWFVLQNYGAGIAILKAALVKG